MGDGLHPVHFVAGRARSFGAQVQQTSKSHRVNGNRQRRGQNPQKSKQPAIQSSLLAFQQRLSAHSRTRLRPISHPASTLQPGLICDQRANPKKAQRIRNSAKLRSKGCPEVAKKVAIAALEDVRRFCKNAGMEDIAQMNRTALGAKLLERRRTRFFVAYADHGIRLSALLFLVASHTRQLGRLESEAKKRVA